MPRERSEPPDYTWDVFLSFRHRSEWPLWVDRHFEPLFRLYLGEDLGTEPEVYVDSEYRQPGDWPTALGRELARSRVLVPLLSRMYFKSPWCRSEYDLMRRRADRCERTLIVPAIIHDGKDLGFLDHAIRQMSVDLTQYANPGMPPDSPTREVLATLIKEWTPAVAAAINAAPPWDPSWEHNHVDAMDETFVEVNQKHLPGWGQ